MEIDEVPGTSGNRKYQTIIIPVKVSPAKETRLIGICKDISDNKDESTLLSGLEEDFYSVIENVSDIIIRYDTDCMRTYVNRSFERVLGISRALAIGSQPTGEWPSKSGAKFFWESPAQGSGNGRFNGLDV